MKSELFVISSKRKKIKYEECYSYLNTLPHDSFQIISFFKLYREGRMEGCGALLSLRPWHPVFSQITPRIQLCHPGDCPQAIQAVVWCAPPHG